MPLLEFSKGPLAGQQIEIDREVIIGREADLSIADYEISRRHVILRPVADGLEVEDLGSTNGTWVDDLQVVAPVLMLDGSTIELGESLAVLRLEGAGETVVRAVPQGISGSNGARPRPAATRLVGAQLLTYLVIAAVAVALVLYFAMR